MLVEVAAAMVFGVLAFSGVSHLIALGDFRSAVSSHRLWPSRLVPALTLALATVEAAIGGAGLIGYSSSDVGAVQPLLFAGCVTLSLFALYAVVVWKLRPGSSCGCSRGNEVVSGWTVARAVVFSVCAAYAAWGPGAPASGSERVLAAVLAVVLTALVWQLPAAMRGQVAWTSDGSGGRVWT